MYILNKKFELIASIVTDDETTYLIMMQLTLGDAIIFPIKIYFLRFFLIF